MCVSIFSAPWLSGNQSTKVFSQAKASDDPGTSWEQVISKMDGRMFFVVVVCPSPSCQHFCRSCHPVSLTTMLSQCVLASLAFGWERGRLLLTWHYVHRWSDPTPWQNLLDRGEDCVELGRNFSFLFRRRGGFKSVWAGWRQLFKGFWFRTECPTEINRDLFFGICRLNTSACRLSS